MLITLKSDIRPPTAPVLGTPTVTSSTALSVPLTTAATDAGPSGVASYAIERSTSSGGTYTVLSSAATFPYADTGLTASTTYYYRARATDASGNVGNYSAIVSATTSAAGSSSWQLAAGHFEPAKIALEIIAPRPSLNTQSPYYKWYPGIPMELPIVVLGGAWPFKYELLSGPSGMTIGETLDVPAFNSSGLQGQAYGILSWANPTESGSPHSISVRVTDQEGATATVSWTLTVTTSGFLFLDPAGNNTNPGTINSPKLNLAGIYNGNINNATFDNQFLIWRAGTYRTDTAPISDGQRIFWRNFKPHVWMAYPGETVTMDTQNAHVVFDGGNDITMLGLNFVGLNASGGYKNLQFGAAPRTLLYKSTFGAQLSAGVTGQNPAFVFIAAGPTSQHLAAIRCTFSNANNTALIETYDIANCVIEGCYAINCTNTNGYYFKRRSNQITVRGNRGTNGRFAWAWDNYDVMRDFDCGWNLFAAANNREAGEFGRDGGTGVSLGVNLAVYRNTLLSGYLNHRDASGGQNVTYTSNVRQHDGTRANGVATANFTGTPTYTNDLVGTTGLIDANGLLIGASRTSYLGLRGYEVG